MLKNEPAIEIIAIIHVKSKFTAPPFSVLIIKLKLERLIMVAEAGYFCLKIKIFAKIG